MKFKVSKNTNQNWHPNIWPPFTQITNSKPQIEVTHGKDALIYTKNPTQELIDGISSWGIFAENIFNLHESKIISYSLSSLGLIIYLFSQNIFSLIKLPKYNFNNLLTKKKEIDNQIIYRNPGQVVSFNNLYANILMSTGLIGLLWFLYILIDIFRKLVFRITPIQPYLLISFISILFIYSYQAEEIAAHLAIAFAFALNLQKDEK